MMHFSLGCGQPGNLRLGPTVSESSSSTKNYSAQTSVQGASGTNSPTFASGGNINYTSDGGAVSQSAIAGIVDVVKQALTGAGAVTTQADQLLNAQQGVQQSANDQNNQLLYDVLANEQNLASYQGSGGAIQQSQSTNYVIWGAIGVAALAFIALMFGRNK